MQQREFNLVQKLRIFLSQNDVVVSERLINNLVYYLGFDEHVELQYESISSLCFINRTELIVKAGAVPILIDKFANPYLCDMSLCALYNITLEYRQIAIECGIISPLIKFMADHIKDENYISISTAILWNLSPESSDLLFYFANLINLDDENIIRWSLFAIYYHTKQNKINKEIVFRVVELLNHYDKNIVKTALCCLENFVANDQYEYVEEMLKIFPTLLNSDYQKYVGLVLSIILAGPYKELVIQAGLIPKIIDILPNNEELAKSVYIFISTATTDQNKYLIKFFKKVNVNDSTKEIIEIVLVSLKKISKLLSNKIKRKERETLYKKIFEIDLKYFF